MTTLTIGKIAKAAGLGVETVRFYERQGLIAEPARSGSGYRQYRPGRCSRSSGRDRPAAAVHRPREGPRLHPAGDR